MKCRLKINGENILLVQRENLLESLNEAQVPIHQSCGGSGTCGTCRFILKGAPSGRLSRSEAESELAEARGFLESEKLACQFEGALRELQDFEIEIPE
jgi:ferredoxin